MKYSAARIVALSIALTVCAGLLGQANSGLYVVTGLSTSDPSFRVGSAVFSVDETRRVLAPVIPLIDADRGSASIVADRQRRVLVLRLMTIRQKCWFCTWMLQAAGAGCRSP